MFLKGKNLYLRKVVEGDAWGNYKHWLNDPEVTRYLYVGAFPTSAEDLDKYIKSLKNTLFLAIICKGVHIGNIKLDQITMMHRVALLGMLIGEAEYRGKGYGQEVIRLILGHAFNKMGLNRVRLSVHTQNLRAIKCYEKSGFKKEGILREHFLLDGEYTDVMVMSILRREYK